MKYLTGILGSTSSKLIDAKTHILLNRLFAFNCIQYNYTSHNPASHRGQAVGRRFSLLYQPFTALRIVHNLCINWQ